MTTNTSFLSVQMFTTVARNFFKFLAAYFCLLVAFALSFSVLFPNYQSFNVTTVAALVKTLVMMAGEIEYENFIYENGDSIFPFTGHFMILLFVVLISIILMNLLVGLAVSDIQVSYRNIFEYQNSEDTQVEENRTKIAEANKYFIISDF